MRIFFNGIRSACRFNKSGNTSIFIPFMRSAKAHVSLRIRFSERILMGGENRHYSMHTTLFLYVGNFILFCKLCHYIMQIVF